MKVTNKMLARDLRIIGAVIKPLQGFIPLKKKNGNPQNPSKHKRHRNTDSSKQSYNEYIRRPDGTEMRLMVKKPDAGKKKVPCVLWIHGGGYALGMPEMQMMSQAKNLAGECVIVSPDYRLSVDAPYPAALDDCYLALVWLKNHGAELGGNTDQIFVGGESAGGGLTVATCLYARDQGDVKIAYQMPLYPMIDNRRSKSMKDNNAPVWNEKQNIAGWELYLDGVSDISEYAVPARAKSYKDMPPAFTFVGSIEPFRDETIAYVNRLKEDGVPVAFKVFKGCFHAFDMMAPWTKEAKEADTFFIKSFEYAKKNFFAKQDE